MKKNQMLHSAVAALLALLLALSVLPFSAFAAISLNEKEEKDIPDDFTWELDFGKMSAIDDNLGSDEYTITTSAAMRMLDFDSQKCLGFTDSSGHFIIEDTNNKLKDYNAFYIEADMYFESYPTGTSSDGHTPHNYPVSFMTWITENAAASPSYGSIRIDDEGYLCTKAAEGARLSDTAKLPLGEWFNIRFVVSPVGKTCEVFVNHESVGSYGISMQNLYNIAKSRVRFFDTRYQYTVYFKNIAVSSDAEYRIGTTEEAAADYVAFQTTAVSGGKFDLRVVAAVDSLDFNSAGFVIDRLYEKNGTAVTDEEEISATVVYETLLAGGKSVKASDYGREYLVALPVKDIDTSLGRTEIVVRPFVKKNGVKRYGDATILVYSGLSGNGTPVLLASTEATEYELSVSMDTYIGGKNLNSSDLSPHGKETVLDIKKSSGGYSSNTTRHTYLKFNISDKAESVIKASSRVYLAVYGLSAAVNTDQAKKDGGILADVYGVGVDWEENELTKANAKELAPDVAYVNQLLYGNKAYYSTDVTDYVLEHADEGEIAFRIENVNVDPSAENTLYSREYGNGEYAAKLVIETYLFGHDINLGKLRNVGYEPWGYTEKLVDAWFERDYDVLYAKTNPSLGLPAVNNNTKNGDYTIENPYKGSSTATYGNDHRFVRTLSTLSGFSSSEETEYDECFGITNLGIKGKETGFYHTETIGGKTYIIDPLGNPFWALGINTVNMGSTNEQKKRSNEKYGDDKNFYTAIADELVNDFGINTAWGWSGSADDGNIAFVESIGMITDYMASLGLSVGTGGSPEFAYNNTMNVFDPDFVSFANKAAKTKAAPYKDNAFLLGYTCDNEIPGGDDILMRYLTLDSDEPVCAFAYAAAWNWFTRATGNPNATTADVTTELSSEFLAFIYNTYFKVISSALKAYDPNHMYLGSRSNTPTRDKEGYLRALGQYVDVMTVNMYGGQDYATINDVIEKINRYAGVPFIVTEFFARAEDATDMNGYKLGNQSNSAGWVVETQEARANSYESYVLNLLESDRCLGWTWYRFRDNDQTIYKDSKGNLYSSTKFDTAAKKMGGYRDVRTGKVYEAAEIKEELTIYYKGESDTSNLGSNKGIYDNFMEPYEELRDSMKTVSENLADLIRFFGK